MEDQAGDAAAGTSTLRRLLFLFQNNMFHFLLHYLFIKKNLIKRGEKNKKPHLVFLKRTHCASRCFVLIIKQRREISELQMRQHFDLAPKLLANKDHLCEATKSHPPHTHTHTHTDSNT